MPTIYNTEKIKSFRRDNIFSNTNFIDFNSTDELKLDDLVIKPTLYPITDFNVSDYQNFN
jgi:hypothetical protein